MKKNHAFSIKRVSKENFIYYKNLFLFFVTLGFFFFFYKSFERKRLKVFFIFNFFLGIKSKAD